MYFFSYNFGITIKKLPWYLFRFGGNSIISENKMPKFKEIKESIEIVVKGIIKLTIQSFIAKEAPYIYYQIFIKLLFL